MYLWYIILVHCGKHHYFHTFQNDGDVRHGKKMWVDNIRYKVKLTLLWTKKSHLLNNNYEMNLLTWVKHNVPYDINVQSHKLTKAIEVCNLIYHEYRSNNNVWCTKPGYINLHNSKLSDYLTMLCSVFIYKGKKYWVPGLQINTWVLSEINADDKSRYKGTSFSPNTYRPYDHMEVFLNFFYFLFWFWVLQLLFSNTTNITPDSYCGSWLIHYIEEPPSQARNAIVRATWVATYTDMFSLMSMISWAQRDPLTPWSYLS